MSLEDSAVQSPPLGSPPSTSVSVLCVTSLKALGPHGDLSKEQLPSLLAPSTVHTRPTCRW